MFLQSESEPDDGFVFKIISIKVWFESNYFLCTDKISVTH